MYVYLSSDRSVDLSIYLSISLFLQNLILCLFNSITVKHCQPSCHPILNTLGAKGCAMLCCCHDIRLRPCSGETGSVFAGRKSRQVACPCQAAGASGIGFAWRWCVGWQKYLVLLGKPFPSRKWNLSRAQGVRAVWACSKASFCNGTSQPFKSNIEDKTWKSDWHVQAWHYHPKQVFARSQQRSENNTWGKPYDEASR